MGRSSLINIHTMKKILFITLTVLSLQAKAQVVDTTFITANELGLFFSHLAIDETGKRTQTDVPIRDTMQQVAAIQALTTQEIQRRCNDWAIISAYTNEIGRMLRDGNTIETQYGVPLFDTTGISQVLKTDWNLRGFAAQTKVYFRVSVTNDRVLVPRLQYSFTKAAGSWKRAYFSPGYLRLTEFDADGFIEFFYKDGSWQSVGRTAKLVPNVVRR